MITFAWIWNVTSDSENTLRILATGILLYAGGGYIRAYDPFKKIKVYVIILIWIAVYGLVFLSYYNMVQIKIQDYNLTGNSFTQTYIMSFHDFSIVTITLGISLFELFKRIKIPNNRIINFLASATLTVYFFHDNSFFYSIWNMQDWMVLLINSPCAFVLKLLLWGFATYIFGMIIYLLYLGIGRLAHYLKSFV